MTFSLLGPRLRPVIQNSITVSKFDCRGCFHAIGAAAFRKHSGSKREVMGAGLRAIERMRLIAKVLLRCGNIVAISKAAQILVKYSY